MKTLFEHQRRSDVGPWVLIDFGPTDGQAFPIQVYVAGTFAAGSKFSVDHSPDGGAHMINAEDSQTTAAAVLTIYVTRGASIRGRLTDAGAGGASDVTALVIEP